MSRHARMEKDGIDPQMPPLSAPELLTMVKWFLQLGPSEAAGMGAGPISWASIHYWQERAGVPLSPWAATMIRQMSVDFLSMADKAKAIDCPSPWATHNNEQNREAISNKIGSIFGARALGKPERD